MRKENYMIGLLNKELLDVRVPFGCISQRRMLTKTLEWNINQCVLEYMFDKKFNIKETFRNDVNGLRHRFRWFAERVAFSERPFDAKMGDLSTPISVTPHWLYSSSSLWHRPIRIKLIQLRHPWPCATLCLC